MVEDGQERRSEVTELEQDEVFLRLYIDYAKILRTWLVAFGVGGPVLFFTAERISDQIKCSGQTKTIVVLFLIGVACQVLNTFINKWVNWCLYSYADPESKKWQKHGYELCNVISEQCWIDIALDLTTFVVFTWATLKVLLICA